MDSAMRASGLGYQSVPRTRIRIPKMDSVVRVNDLDFDLCESHLLSPPYFPINSIPTRRRVPHKICNVQPPGGKDHRA